MFKPKTPISGRLENSSGEWIRTNDLRVMSTDAIRLRPRQQACSATSLKQVCLPFSSKLGKSLINKLYNSIYAIFKILQLPGKEPEMKTALLLTVCALLLMSACQTGLPSPTEAALPPAQAPTDSPAPTQMPTLPPPPRAVLDASEKVAIAAGTFWLGCDPAHNNNLSCLQDELPSQSVQLPDFKIDKYEVTNARYAECVQAGACTAPSSLASETRGQYFDNPEFIDFPVIFVSWKQAAAYCTWAGKRLPTEAEWEKAARGTTKNTFPWSDAAPNCKTSNAVKAGGLERCAEDTQPVGSYAGGASPYGVMDLAGNVWEWTASRYLPNYLPGAPEEALTGQPADLYRVVRGGGWDSAPLNLIISSRSFDPDFHNSNNLGFRCAMDSLVP
jgi:formylglycine-generating enzyme required for sulfatase activity